LYSGGAVGFAGPADADFFFFLAEPFFFGGCMDASVRHRFLVCVAHVHRARGEKTTHHF
jgi:hypothetical protein